MLADAGPAISGWPPGGVAVPPYATGICAAYPGSALLAVVTTGLVVPHQLLVKFLRLEYPGGGRDPPLCRSTTWPYQLAVMLLFLNLEFSASCGGEFVPPLASRNKIPAVQLLVTKFSTNWMLSVWLRKIRPVRLKSITLFRIV